jgi:hypothetical protein
MLGRLLEGLFGCWHGHYSFPITVRPGRRHSEAASLTGTYVVCLDCGKERSRITSKYPHQEKSRDTCRGF